MTSRYTLHEPFPHYSHVQAMPFGRGGAGNRTSSTVPSKRNTNSAHSNSASNNLPPVTIHNYPVATTTTPTTVTTTSGAPVGHTSQAHPGPNYSTGRGGAGNMHDRDEQRAIFHFDEELEREKRRSANMAPVYHVGRGGNGNVVDKRRGSDSSSGDSSEVGLKGGVAKGKKGLEWVKGLARK